MLYDKIKAIYPALTDADFLDKIRLQDDGKGPYIAHWPDELPLPTDKQIEDAVPRQAKESADPVALLAAFLKENPEVLALVSK